MSAPFDTGLQPERTLLAWRRTCLALGLGSAVAVRFTAEEFGAVGVALGAVGVVLAGGAYLAAAARYRRVHDDLTAGSVPTGDGRALALLAGAVIVLGVAGGLYIFTR